MNDFWEGRRVGISGAAGFIGAHLARALVDRGASVLGLDIVSDSPCWRVHGLPGRAELTRCDIFNRDNLLYHLDPERFRPSGRSEPRAEVVFHLAGTSGIRQAQIDPMVAFENNVRSTWTVLEVCRELSARIVIASSNHIAGAQASWPIDEAAALNQTDVYGTSKICADLLVRCYGHSLGVTAVALRHTNCFGEADPHSDHIVPAVMRALLESRRPVIHSDGSPRKAYLAVSDVVAAYMLLAERANEVAGQSFYAARTPVSVLELVRLIIAISGRDVAPDIQATDLSQGGSEEHFNDAALRRLGWQPAVDLEEALRTTWEWFEKNGGLWWGDPIR